MFANLYISATPPQSHTPSFSHPFDSQQPHPFLNAYKRLVHAYSYPLLNMYKRLNQGYSAPNTWS